MQLRTVLVVALLLLGACSAEESIDGILQSLQQYCPYYGFDGSLQCPSSVSTKYERKEAASGSYIRSGLGYDRVTREIRFPVLPSTAPASAVSQSYQTYRYTDVNDYINSVYAEKSWYSGGLYVLGNAFVNQFASIFGNYRIDMTVTQKLYNSYATSIASKAVIPEFQQILYTLPTVYNPNNATLVNLYRTRIIDIFGTDVTTSSTHGGIFFQQAAVKSCYGGNVAPDMTHEMDTTLAKQPAGNLAYIHYRSLGVFDVKGGNPEIPHSEYPQLIASFPQDPAITAFNSIPLWQIVPPQYTAAVQAAIAHYTNDNQVSLNSLVSTIEAQKVASYKAPQTVFVYGQQTEQFGSIIHWTNCPFLKEGGNYYTPRCTILIQAANLNAGQTSTFVNIEWQNRGILHYESQRDAPSGQMRIYNSFHPTYSMDEILRQANITHVPYTVEDVDPTAPNAVNSTLGGVQDNVIVSPWEHTGCVSLDYIYLTACRQCKTYFTVCIDCLPIVSTSPARYGLKDSDLQCVCPGF